MRLWIIVVIGLCWALPSPARAEFYRYRDAAGAIRYTDNLADVPPAQREGMTAYQGAPVPAETPQPDAGARDGRDGQPAEAGPEPGSREAYEALQRRHQDLQREFAALQEERRELERITGQTMKETELAPYREKLEGLNARTRAYQEKRTIYEKDLAAYTAAAQARRAGGGQATSP